MPCQISETDSRLVLKNCILHNYEDATFIISKRTYNAGTIEQLTKYISDKIEAEKIDFTKLLEV
jgi:hypothetical protein